MNVNVNCMLCHSAYVLSKLILKLSKEFEIKLITRYKTFAAKNGEFERSSGFCVDCYYTGVKGGNVIFDCQADFHPEI